MMNFKELEKELKSIDEKMPVLKATCTTKQENAAMMVSLDLLKLETIDRFIRDRCDDEEIKLGFDQYRQIALSTIKAYLNTL